MCLYSVFETANILLSSLHLHMNKKTFFGTNQVQQQVVKHINKLK